MNKNIMKAIVAVLVVSLTILACGGQTITETPAAINEPQHEIYAGFTDNEAMPFIMIHNSGESLVVTQDVNSSNVTGVVWTSTNGESIVIYTDSDGMPKSAVIGKEVILYSNYANDTVDITIIHADGTRETFQSKLDADLLNKIKSFVPPSDKLITYSISKLRSPDMWFYMQFGLYLVSAGTCLSLAATGVGIPMAAACGGFLLSSVIRTADIYHLDVGPLKDLKTVINIAKCATATEPLGLVACMNLIITETEKQEKLAREVISNPNYSGLQLDTIPFDSVPTNPPTPVISIQQAPPGIYPIGREYSQSVNGWSAILDYIEVLDNGTLKVSNVWTNNLNECLYQGDCQAYCSEENDDAGALMTLINGDNIAPIETNCTFARGQVWDVPPGETFNDWAIYPPLEDATMSFSITWYALGSVDNIVLVTSP